MTIKMACERGYVTKAPRVMMKSFVKRTERRTLRSRNIFADTSKSCQHL